MPQLYLVEWIFTLFAKVLPEEPVGWIWDQILLLGDEHIFKTGLGLLQLLQTKFLAMDDLGAVLMVLKDLEKSHVLAEALFEARDTKDVLFKDLAALKRDRWLSLYRCAEKIKLKPALWKQLLVDLQEFEEQIEEAGERDSALLSLVMALDNLDVDEEEANKIARAMQKGRRNAVATLEFGDTDVAAAAATAAAAAAVQPRTKERRHSLPDVMTPQAEWINVPTSAVRKTLTDAHDSSGEEPDNSSEDEMEAEAPAGHDQRRRPSLPMTAAAVGFAVLVPGALPMAAAAAAASHYHEHHPAEEAETRAAGGGAAGRIRGAADRVRRASVEGIHHLPGMSEGVPPTSQHSPARAAGTEYVMRSLTPELEELLGRCCANSTHNPLPEDLAQLQAVAAKNIGGPLLLPWMRCSLEDGLQSEATPVIVKTLRLLVNLMAHAGGNRENFARRMKADFGGAAGGLERASGYCAVDADHGEKPAALVRKLATQVQALLLGA